MGIFLTFGADRNIIVQTRILCEIAVAEQLPFADVQFATNTEPRCPCVLLIDVSGSMAEIISDSGKDLGYTVQQDGKTYNAVSGGVTRIDKVNEGLRAYQSDILGDALAARRVEVSVITFGSQVETVVPFVSASLFEPPTLVANGETKMGAAILEAIDAIEQRKQLYRQNAVHYYRPWIFLITDGVPTDGSAWQTAAAKVHEGERSKKFAFFAVGVQGADMDTLKKISVRQPLALKGYSFKEMFLWLSQSQRSVSLSGPPGNEDQVKLEPPTGWTSL